MNVNEKNPQIFGIIAGILTIISIILILKVSAIFGAVIYFISLVLSFINIKKDGGLDGGNYIEYIKSCLTKENIVAKGISIIVILILPIMIALLLYGWIYLDTIREVDSIIGSIK